MERPYAVTVWMLCVTPHIREYVLVNKNVENMKQVNVFIKILFHVISDDEMNDTLDKFWSEYTAFNHNNCPFNGDYFICSSKDTLGGNSHVWHNKYSIPCTKVLGFVACRVIYKILGIGADERYWGDVKKIESGKISAISSNVLEKQSIVYTYACIELGKVVQIGSDYNIDEHYPRNLWYDDDEVFNNQLERWGVDMIYKPTSVIIELRTYTEELEINHTKKSEHKII